MARFAKVLKLTQDINVLSLKIRLTVNSLSTLSSHCRKTVAKIGTS
jgi:hypothetical protein